MSKLKLFLLGTLMLFLMAGLGAFALKAAASLSTQEELDYGEGIVLWQAANVMDWKTAYHPVEDYPHVVFHYPPLFHLTSRLFAGTTGHLLTAGRLTSILSLIGSCIVITLLTAMCLPSSTSTTGRWVAALGAGTFIFTTPVWGWACFMRVDALAIFLSIAGIALFVLARKRPVLTFLSFAFFVAAVYTKQTMIAAPAACVLLAFLQRPRLAAYLLVFAVSAGLMVLFILQNVTDGLFLRNIIGYNQNPFLLRHVFGRWIEHGSKLPALLAVVAVIFPGALFCRRVRSLSRFLQRVRLALGRSAFERCVIVVATYFWFAVAVVTVTIGKQGADYYYFFEVDIAASILSGLFLGWLLRRVSFRRRGLHASLAILVISLFLMHSVGNLLNLYQAYNAFSRPAYNHSADVVRFLQALPGPVYSEDMTILQQAGKEIPAEPAIITALAMNNQWDESSFLRRISNGEFRAIVVHSLENRERFTESIAKAVYGRYSLYKEFGSFKVFLPK